MKVFNRKAKRDYEILEEYEAGIVLKGPEVKSAKKGRIKLEDSYVRIRGNEVFLINSYIAPYEFSDNRDYDSRRERKLLLSKKEIRRIEAKLKSSGRLTVVPLFFYTKGALVKVKIALARGRKKFEKKKLEKEREIKRAIDREIKEYLKS